MKLPEVEEPCTKLIYPFNVVLRVWDFIGHALLEDVKFLNVKLA